MELNENLKNSKGFLSIKEAAALLDIHPMTFRKYIWRGDLPYIQVRKKILLLPNDLADYLLKYRKGGRKKVSE